MFVCEILPPSASDPGGETGASLTPTLNDSLIQKPKLIMNHHPYLPPEPLEDRIAPAGLVTVSYSAAGVLSLSGDNLDNSVDVFKTGADTYQIKGLNGTMLSSSGGPVSVLNVGKLSSVTINGNGGADDFGLTDLAVSKGLNFNGGAGLDFVISTNLAVKGDVTFDLGADGGLIAFTGASTMIGGDFKAIYGDGGGSVDFFCDSTTIKGAVKLMGGGGDDAFSFGDAVNVDKGLSISDPAGGMSVAFQNANIVIGSGKNGDAIRFDGGTGVDSLKFVGGDVTLKGGLSFSGRGGADVVNLNATNLRVGGRTFIDGGADADLIKIAGAQVSLGKGITVFGGGGGDDVTVSGDKLTVNGFVHLDGGDGDDTLNLFSSDLNISGTVLIEGGNGANVSSVFADGSIKGDVYLEMGGADGGGDQTFLIGGLSGAVGALKIGGTLNVHSQATDPLSNGFTDFFWATDVTVGRNVNIAMGAVDSTVNLDNIFVRGGLNINTGAGNDVVDFERNGLTGPSMIGRLASIQLGAGNDVIRIGKSSAPGSNDYVIFEGGLRVDGGPGTDSSNDFLNDSVNVFDNSSHGDGHDDNDDDGDDDDDHDDRGFDGGNWHFIKERLNFEGPFIV